MAYEPLNLPDNAIPEGADITHIEGGITELNTSLAELLVVTSYTFAEITFSGQLGQSGVVDCTVTPPTGYKNIGVVGVNTTNNNVTCSRCFLSGSTNVRASFIYTASTSTTASPEVYVLAVKS